MNDRKKVDTLDRRKHFKRTMIAILLAIPSAAQAELLRHTHLFSSGETAAPVSWMYFSLISAAILIAAGFLILRRKSARQRTLGWEIPPVSPSEDLINVFQSPPQLSLSDPEIMSPLRTPGITYISLTGPDYHRFIPEIVTTELPSPAPYTSADFFETAPKPPPSAYHRTSRPPLPLREDPRVIESPTVIAEVITPGPVIPVETHTPPTQEPKAPIPFPEPTASDPSVEDDSPLEAPTRLTPYQRMKRRQVVPIRGKHSRSGVVNCADGPEDTIQQK